MPINLALVFVNYLTKKHRNSREEIYEASGLNASFNRRPLSAYHTSHLIMFGGSDIVCGFCVTTS